MNGVKTQAMTHLILMMTTKMMTYRNHLITAQLKKAKPWTNQAVEMRTKINPKESQNKV